LIERIGGEEALSLFLRGTGLDMGSRGAPFLEQLAFDFMRIPYENISKIIKMSLHKNPCRALRLPQEVVADHLSKGMGGTCFSLTFLLERMLRSLGFDCYKVMADMNSGPKVHCLVIVREGGSRYLMDPGYALNRLIELPRTGSRRVVCPHAVVALTVDGGRYNLWTEDVTGCKWRYGFDDRAVPDPEFESHWIASFSKPTIRNICLTRMTPRGHIYLRKDFFKFTSRGAVKKCKVAGGIHGFIEENFGIKGEWIGIAQEVLGSRRCNTWQR
jgi:arylamine N-acetyltransferase